MSGDLILVLDAGTTSTRAVLYAPDGRVLGMAQAAITQHYPAAGLVEHDAQEIFDLSLSCLREMVAKAGGAGRIAALGITNQRETSVAWDRATGVPITRAIVWQDRRTADTCAALREAGHEVQVQARTGLVLDPYFSASKYGWICREVPEAAELGGRLALGTVESWLVWKLTGGLHVSDATNASRTALMALDGRGWDSGLCDLFAVPEAALPAIVGCAEAVGTAVPDLLGGAIPIAGMAGDQQAATIGQGCLAAGEVKGTFGTGAFVLASTGHALPRSAHRLLGTVLCEVGGVRSYALEGSVFVAGSLMQWLRDRLGILANVADSAGIAASLPDSGGVVIVPALSGLGAPHWRPDVRGVIAGLSHGSGRAQIVRAALEAMAHQCLDLKAAFAADGADWGLLRIDGGMSGNDWMAQDLADVLEVVVKRPGDIETTARGAAMLAGVGAGMFDTLDAAGAAMRSPAVRFEPAMAPAVRAARLAGWHAELARLDIGR